MIRVAVLDDWQQIARASADWSGLSARADVTFFSEAFADEGGMRRRNCATSTSCCRCASARPLPASLIGRLDRCRCSASPVRRTPRWTLQACTARGVPVCNTTGYPDSLAAPAELALGLLLAVVRAIPAGRCRHSRRTFPGRDSGRHDAGGQDTGGGRARPARCPHGSLWQRAGDESFGLEVRTSRPKPPRPPAPNPSPRRTCSPAPMQSASTWCCHRAGRHIIGRGRDRTHETGCGAHQ